MRVLLTTDSVGGVLDYASTLARGLVAAGHEVLLAFVDAPADDVLASAPPAVETARGGFRLAWMPGGLADVRPSAVWLRRLAERWDADVVHLNQMAPAGHGLGRPTLVVAHSDVLSWMAEVQGAAVRDEWLAYARAVRRGLAAADLVVAPTRYQSELLRRHYGHAADRVIWNAAEAPEETSAGNAPNADAGGAPACHSASVLTMGRAWDAAKGVAVLDEALGLVRGPRLQAHLLGTLEGPAGEAFRPQRLRAHGRVPKPETRDWLARARVYVAPSLYEPFGLAPLEAALHGCALVLSDIGSFRELWGGAALFHSPRDAHGLAAALETLRDDDGYRVELARRARRRAIDHFGPDRQLAQYLDAYAALAGTARTQPSVRPSDRRDRQRAPTGARAPAPAVARSGAVSSAPA